MPIDQRELRHLLDERSRPALDRPIPWHSLRARTRGARWRQLSAVMVAVTAVTAGTIVGLRGLQEVDQLTSAQVTEKLPIQYQEPDGTTYRRLAIATFDPSKEKSKTFPVEVSGKPVAVLPDCPSDKAGPQPLITARVPGAAKTYTLSLTPFPNSCAQGAAADMAPFQAGTRRATFTITAIPNAPAGKWRFGVYEWTPPATMKAASSAAEPRAKIGKDLSLVTKGSAIWPGSREVTLTVPNRGRTLAVLAYCGDGLAGRLPLQVRVNGHLVKGISSCAAPPTGPEVGSMAMARRPLSEETLTITVRLVAPMPEYLQRPGTLTVALYDSVM
ncbi:MULTISPECIES: hypothetical protein [unclassified Nonomuraea]|uniref:hypothetical protein n=1 Tax=unclassified Nonomuraea TaxID=2593643 RepID=UPI0034489562